MAAPATMEPRETKAKLKRAAGKVAREEKVVVVLVVLVVSEEEAAAAAL